MSPQLIFQLHLVLGYVAWLLCFGVYVMPKLKTMDRVSAQRAMLRCIASGFSGSWSSPRRRWPPLPAGFSEFAAYGNIVTGMLAILTLLTVRIRPHFWSFVVAVDLVGTTDILVDYYHAAEAGLPTLAGQLGAAYAIPIVYVPLLMITHAFAL